MKPTAKATRAAAPQAAAPPAFDLVPSGFFAFRTPLLPFEELEAWSEGLSAISALSALSADPAALAAAIGADQALLRARLKAALGRPEIAEALFLASPSLF